jgi:hypothetical protein
LETKVVFYVANLNLRCFLENLILNRVVLLVRVRLKRVAYDIVPLLIRFFKQCGN